MARRQAGAPAVAGENGNGTNGATAITAAARVVDLEGKERDGYRRKAKSETWQTEAWSFFDIVGEVKQPTYFLANTCSLVRLYIGYQPDPEQDPVEAPAGMAGVFEAKDVLDRLSQGSRGGLAGLVRETILNHKVTGECWLAGIPEQAEVPATQFDDEDNPIDGEPYRPEAWDVRSVSEVFTKGNGRNLKYWYKEDPGDNKGKQFPKGTFLLRVWLEHPEFSELADCALRALLTECEELLILTRAVKATGRSRLAGAGVILMSNDLEVVPPPRQTNEPAGAANDGAPSFAESLMDAMTMPIANEGDPSAVVPLIVRGPTEAIKEFKHVTFDRQLDVTMIEQRKELIQRMAQGSDVPIEVVVGLKNINHWTAYQVDQSTWTRYGHPAVRAVVDAWTTGLLRPMLEEAGLSSEVAARLLVWFDPAGAVSQPDRSADVLSAFDRFAISWTALRTYLNLSEGDAPDDDEVAQRIMLAAAMKGGGQGSGGTDSSQDAPPGGPTEQGPPNDGTPPNDPNARIRPAPLGDGSAEVLQALAAAIAANGGHLPPALASANRRDRRQRAQPLGRRLMSIDRRCRAGLAQVADAAMMRALDQAGARLRNNAKRIPALRARVADEPAWRVPSLLGATAARSLGFESDDELLAGTFDGMEPKFQQMTSAAQAQTLELLEAEYDLDPDEVRSLQVQQQRDRNDAWVWLAGAMLALGHDRLYQPQPEAPARGEFDASATVPPDLLREALSRAGGAASGGAGRDQPAGGIALGDLVRDVWARHGQVVDGWEWVYGDPSSRTTPFEPHEDLDGVQFASWDDDVLLNPGDWPPVPFLRPGDHIWCQCDFAPVGPGALGGDEEAATEDAVPADE